MRKVLIIGSLVVGSGLAFWRCAVDDGRAGNNGGDGGDTSSETATDADTDADADSDGGSDTGCGSCRPTT